MGRGASRVRRATGETFEDLVDLFAQTGLTCSYTETPEAVNISLLDVPEDSRGQGIGTRFLQAAKAYCDRAGKQLVVSEVDNTGFFSRFPFLNYEPPQPGEPRPRFHSSQQTCPTCGDPLQGRYETFCPRCSWSEDDANLDTDPLSNPPDPTRDMHKGIQSRTIPSHRWDRWFTAVETL